MVNNKIDCLTSWMLYGIDTECEVSESSCRFDETILLVLVFPFTAEKLTVSRTFSLDFSYFLLCSSPRCCPEKVTYCSWYPCWSAPLHGKQELGFQNSPNIARRVLHSWHGTSLNKCRGPHLLIGKIGSMIMTENTSELDQSHTTCGLRRLTLLVK